MNQNFKLRHYPRALALDTPVLVELRKQICPNRLARAGPNAGAGFSFHATVTCHRNYAAGGPRQGASKRRRGHDALRMLCRRFSCCVTASSAAIDFPVPFGVKCPCGRDTLVSLDSPKPWSARPGFSFPAAAPY